MPTVTNSRLLYASHPTGFQEPEVHTKYVEEQVDTDEVLLEGGVLIKTQALSSDPYIRVRMRDPKISAPFSPIVLGHPVDNFGVGTVIRSEKPEFKPGDFVYGYLGFEDYTVHPGPRVVHHGMQFLQKLQKHPDLPASIYVGTLGMPGQTAYSGWHAYAFNKAKTSKTLFVSSAAGPVGTFVIEYARYKHPHLKIIASAGSPEKLDVLMEAGADVLFNYKTDDLSQVLAEHGPIDIYWDHVGGATLDATISHMNNFGLILRVGTSSVYNTDSPGLHHIKEMVFKSLTIQGFIVGVGPVMEKALEGFHEEVTKLVLEGKIKSREKRYKGIAEAGVALAEVHTGQSFGKPVIIVEDH